MKSNIQIGSRYAFAAAAIMAGLLLNFFEVGNEFLGFTSVGSWLLYVGFVMLMIITLQLISKKKRKIDERMEFIAAKAGRITFVAIIFATFIVMIIDGISPITTPYSYFMSYFISGIVAVYFVAYRILLKYN